MAETTDPIKMHRALLGIHGEVAKVQALDEKLKRGEGDYSEKRMMGIMREYLTNISKEAAKLGDDIDEIAPGVLWDNIRGWRERLAKMSDSEVQEVVSEVVPALERAVDQAMSAKDEDDEGEQRREPPPQMQAGPGRLRMNGSRQERAAGERVAAVGPVRMDGRPSGTPRVRRGARGV